MNIDRERSRSAGRSKKRVEFCLDMLEDAEGFEDDIEWTTNVVPSLTVEEIVGALVSAEMDLEPVWRRSQ